MEETQIPLFETPSNWTPPSHLPNLSDAKEIAIDTECKDPNLIAKGPGYLRKDGFVAGVSLSTDTGFTGYFPLAHAGGGNLDTKLVATWLLHELGKDRDYIFVNAQYDLGWLRTLGIECRGHIIDLSVVASLIDEELDQGYSLDALCKLFLGKGKDEELLRQAASNWEVDPKKDLWKLPAKMVGVYAETDAVRTLQLWQVLKQELTKQDLWPIFHLERQVTPILFEMFWRGIRVDLAYAEELHTRWLAEENALLRQLGMSGEDIWTPAAIVAYCQRHRISFPYTEPTARFPNGQPSITAEFMEHSGHPELLPLRKLRAINRTRDTFLGSVLLRGHLNGRIHPQYIQLACDEGGTRAGRLAARNPNAQQFPKRSKLFDAKAIRKVMLPEEGCLWNKLDYWSQEPTLMVHYALLKKLPKAEMVRDQFALKKKLYTIIEQDSQGACNYDDAKQVALARSYGQQIRSMARSMGITEDAAAGILTKFDESVPFIGLLASALEARAQSVGVVKTILGRKCHFNLWEPVGGLRWFINEQGLKEKEKPLRLPEAEKKWPGKSLKRAFTYKAFNRLIQGSAADQGKKAIVDVNSALGLPMFPVHDELSKSVKDRAEALEMKRIVEQAIPLLCPAQADMELGVSWC